MIPQGRLDFGRATCSSFASSLETSVLLRFELQGSDLELIAEEGVGGSVVPAVVHTSDVEVSGLLGVSKAFFPPRSVRHNTRLIQQCLGLACGE